MPVQMENSKNHDGILLDRVDYSVGKPPHTAPPLMFRQPRPRLGLVKNPLHSNSNLQSGERRAEPWRPDETRDTSAASSKTVARVSIGSSAWFGLSILRRWRSAQESFRAQMLVKIRPVNPISSTAGLPMCPLRWRGPNQARIPCQRNGDRPPVCQVHGQQIVSDGQILNALVSAECQNAHARKIPETRDCPL
jgi:hypothetical protein